ETTGICWNPDPAATARPAGRMGSPDLPSRSGRGDVTQTDMLQKIRKTENPLELLLDSRSIQPVQQVPDGFGLRQESRKGNPVVPNITIPAPEMQSLEPRMALSRSSGQESSPSRSVRARASLLEDRLYRSDWEVWVDPSGAQAGTGSLTVLCASSPTFVSPRRFPTSVSAI